MHREEGVCEWALGFVALWGYYTHNTVQYLRRAARLRQENERMTAGLLLIRFYEKQK